MLRDRLPKILYEHFQDAARIANQYKTKWEDLPQIHRHYQELADKILAEIPEITEAFCIQSQIEWERSDRTVSGFQYLCNAINEKIREGK